MQQRQDVVLSTKRLWVFILTVVLSVSLMPSLAFASTSSNETTLSVQSAESNLDKAVSVSLGQNVTGNVYRGNGQEVYHVYSFSIPADGNYRLHFSNTRWVASNGTVGPGSKALNFTLYNNNYKRIYSEIVGANTTDPHYYDFWATKGRVTVTVEAGTYSTNTSMDFSCSLVRAGWSTENGNRYYYNPNNGELAKGWQTIEGQKYYFSPQTGAAVSGLTTIDNKRYFFDSSTNVLQTGWKTISGKKYYFTSNGAAASGLTKIGSKRYYFDPSSKQMVVKCWKTIGGKKYYFTSTGAAASGLAKIGKQRYYFTPSTNAMSKGLKTVSGKKYYFGSNGAAVKGWKTIGGKKYYFSKNTAAAVKGWNKISKKYYYFNSNGTMAKSKWIGKYHVNAKGVRDRVRK